MTEFRNGQRWTIEHGGEFLAECIIARARGTYVTVWPVTTDGFTMPGFVRLDAETICWPGLETGLDARLLGRLVSTPFETEDVMEEVWQKFLTWSDTQPTIPEEPTDEQAAWIAKHLPVWEKICFMHEEDWR